MNSSGVFEITYIFKTLAVNKNVVSVTIAATLSSQNYPLHIKLIRQVHRRVCSILTGGLHQQWKYPNVCGWHKNLVN